MSTAFKNHRFEEKKNRRRGALADKSSSFHGRSAMPLHLFRPKTVPELAIWRNPAAVRSGDVVTEPRPKLSKLLLNVTIRGSLGPVHVVISPESKVGDLISAAVKLYVKEARRPILKNNDPAAYDLHYSQFCLESLDRCEKLMDLGSRNFFLCPRAPIDPDTGIRETTTMPSVCSKESERIGVPWLRFISFLL